MADSEGGAVAAVPARKARTYAHSIANYSLALVGGVALWIWWFGWRNFCLEPGAGMKLGPFICSSDRADYYVIPAGGIVLLLLLLELHSSSRDLVKQDFLRPARAIAHSYKSLERKERIHLKTSTLSIFVLAVVFSYFYFFSDWIM